ncbi:ComF family protein [Nocardia fluminea]|uniref:ComF family protein n=1 Tax=Nocardia fluminea TaxID=134984 RepID=UPI00364924FE
MPSSNSRQQLLDYIQEAISPTYRNTYIEGVCVVCRGPAPRTERCWKCNEHFDQFGHQLADQTVLLTYAQAYHPGGYHQTVQDLLAYKGSGKVPQSRESLVRLGAVGAAAAALHLGCIRRVLGGVDQWDVVTFVPSTRFPGFEHPVATIAATLVAADPTEFPQWVQLLPNNMQEKHRPSLDRFVVAPGAVPTVQGAHVLVIDDTWTTGANVQSAAMALKGVGAATVTVLCLARWLRWDYANHAELCGTLSEPYSPTRCPVGMCSPSI